MRREFELSQEQFRYITEAAKPPVLASLGGIPLTTVQEQINNAWRRVANERGFKWDTAEPVPGKHARFISAEIEEPS